MKALLLFISVLSISLIALSNQDSKKVAIVKMLRGKAQAISPAGKTLDLKKGSWLQEGSIIETSAKSFVKLGFIDKSSMNVGPKSKLKIEKFSKKEAGVINVLSGKIRSEVTKNYLDMEKNKSKLFVKSKNAVMGIRGTDFLFSTNPKTKATTAVLFEGSVVFKKLDKKDNLRDLESIVNKGRRINPGEFSVADKKRSKTTVPAKLSSKQFSNLFKNKDFVQDDSSAVQQKKAKSVVPPGLTGLAVQGESEVIKEKVQAFVPDIANKEVTKEAYELSKGFVKGEDIKPADGSVVHIDTGMVIPVSKDATFDQSKGEWVSSSMGTITPSGDYLPPEGFKVSDDGKMLKIDGNVVKEVIVDIQPVDKQVPLEDQKEIVYTKESDRDSSDDSKDGPEPASINEDEASKEDDQVLERTPTPGDEGFISPVEQNPTKTNTSFGTSTKTKVKFQVNEQ